MLVRRIRDGKLFTYTDVLVKKEGFEKVEEPIVNEDQGTSFPTDIEGINLLPRQELMKYAAKLKILDVSRKKNVDLIMAINEKLRENE